ncbi:MAG: cation diffusion facilitator family transporter [Deltaproteobacteria bacterium]|nr:cation diffusion facilitator family transporter [Deltaproteobacteria bacterium]
MGEGSQRAIVAAMLANLGLAVAKFVAFLATGASSMLAESIHSVADTGNQGLLFWGGRSARREPTPEHAFGFGRERYFWAFIVALVLFSLGAVFAIYEGLHKVRHPEPLVRMGWAIGVLLFGVVLETFSLRTAVVEAREPKGSSTWWEYIRHSKSPEIPVVLLEDCGALFGLVLALTGIGLVALTGDPRWDGYMTIAIGALLGVIAIVIAIEMKSLLIGESATLATTNEIVDALESHPRVRRVIHMRTQHMGPDQLLVAAKIEFDAQLSIADLASVIDEAEVGVRERVPIAVRIYLEPDLQREVEAATSP